MRKKTCLVVMAVTMAALVVSCTESGQNSKSYTALVASKHAQINGTSDTAKAHNAVVGIGDNTYGVFCTGTLIHPQWVLTAAHCVTTEEEDAWGNPTGKIILAAPKWVGVGNNENKLTKYNVDKTYYHSKYGDRELDSDYGTIDADIAILKLKTAVPSSVAEPILPHPKWLPIASNDLPLKMEFVGFGYNEKADSGKKLTFTSDVTKYCGAQNAADKSTGCKAGSVTIGKSSGSWYKTCKASTVGSVCHPAAATDYNYSDYCYCGDKEYILMPYGGFYYTQENGGPCQGDSGGPAFVKLGGKEYLAGITSYGDAACAAFGISTSVHDFYDWIIEKAPVVADQYKEICDNKFDDTGNGLVDCADSSCDTDANCHVKEICDDKIDNNGDNLIDCNDPQCADALNCQPEICDDKIDNNGNNLIDCNDPQCADALNCKPEICDDKIDNNGDNLIDCNDPQCANALNCQPEICDDKIDNNGNNLIDCDDPQCADALNCKTEICDDKIDNNGNNLIDCDDPQCANALICKPEICDDKIDNDNNGLIDCDDPACTNDVNCKSSTTDDNAPDADNNSPGNQGQPSGSEGNDSKDGANNPTAKVEVCNNSIDDDMDGLIDCDDPDCSGNVACPGTAVITGEICDNKLDDDGDGMIDCQDPDCTESPYCSGTSKASKSGCSTAPTQPQAPFAAIWFAIFGSCMLILRRKQRNI